MYTKGEVVWAKIKGFPWWPGVVISLSNILKDLLCIDSKSDRR